MYLRNLLIGTRLIMDIIGVLLLLYSDWNQDIYYDKRKELWKEAKTYENGNLKELPYALSKKQCHRRLGLFLLILGFLLQFSALFV